jgi:hypothetical protein
VNTRATKNLLDDVFKRPEKEVKYFVGVMAAGADDDVIPGAKKSAMDRIKSGKPEKIISFQLATQIAGGVSMNHGWVDEDYVWHIEPAPRRKWASSVDRAIYATAKTMKDVVPDDVLVKIFRPVASWEVKVFTFKAIGLKRCWNVTESDIKRLNEKLFTVLNTLI